MAKILLIEDGEDTQKIVQAILSNHNVVIASDLASGKTQLENDSFDLVLLDVDLPDGNGFQFFAGIQPDHPNLPIIFLTGKDQEVDKITGFSLGAEDYIVKPIQPAVFKVQIDNKVKKIEFSKSQNEFLNYGDLNCDLPKQKATIQKDSKPIDLDLTSLEFKILVHFCKNPEKIYSRKELIQIIWGTGTHVTERTVDTHISNLRIKLEPSDFTVHSIYGSGYSFKKR